MRVRARSGNSSSATSFGIGGGVSAAAEDGRPVAYSGNSAIGRPTARLRRGVVLSERGRVPLPALRGALLLLNKRKGGVNATPPLTRSPQLGLRLEHH